jgi:hypothetical protein
LHDGFFTLSKRSPRGVTGFNVKNTSLRGEGIETSGFFLSYSGLNLVLQMGLQQLGSTVMVLVETLQEYLTFSLVQSIDGACKSAEYS